ncbi:unnamed protein product [Clonostachys byssicola]|uniref:Uncharacterized protein n=1 Tax=Clonostachys byssicola TaxID=160290 RepID=A0A9N9XXE7_9HYPO|nr:unnamed protein product [Clonostachys byssicola]
MSRLEESLREPGTRSSRSDPSLIDLRASLAPSDKSNAPSHSPTAAPEQVATRSIASHVEGRRAPVLDQQKQLEQSRKRPAEYDLDGQPQTRRAPSRASEPRDELGQSPQDRMLASLDLQRYLLSSKRESRIVDADRQAVLEAAISVAKRVTGEAAAESDCHCRTNLYDPSMYPTAECIKEWFNVLLLALLQL